MPTLEEEAERKSWEMWPELMALVHGVTSLRGFHRKCRQPLCKRARRCVGPGTPCIREQAGPLPTRARRLAALRRAIRNGEAELPP